MKRAATDLFKWQSKNHAFFKIVQFLFWFKTPRARERSKNPTPGAPRMCESPQSPGGMVRHGTDWYIRLWFDNSRTNCSQSRLTAGARSGTVFNSNSCDRIIDKGLPAEDRKQHLLVMTPRKAVLYIGQLPVRILNLILFFRGIEHTIIAAKDSSWLDIEIRHKHNQLVIHLIMEKSKNWNKRPRPCLHVICHSKGASLFKKEA